MRRVKKIMKILGFLGFLSVPNVLNWLGFNPTLFLTWDQVVNEFLNNHSHYLYSFLFTFVMGMLSLVLSLIIGLMAGLVFAYYDKWLGFMEDVMKFIWSVPLIVVAVYLNIFIDNRYIFLLITGSFLGVFPIIAFSYNKAVEMNDGIISIAASYNMSKLSEFVHLRFRDIRKNMSFALDQSIPLTFIGITMGEYTIGRAAGSNVFGLGSDFQYGMQYSKYEIVYVSIIFMVSLVYLSGEASKLPNIANWIVTAVKKILKG